MELIGDLGKATQKGVAVNEAKVELWGLEHTLDGSKFGPWAVSLARGWSASMLISLEQVKDLDLTDSTRELIHKGKVFRQPEGPIGSSWVELIVLLFDNYGEWRFGLMR